jgi:hypothetical protein
MDVSSADARTSSKPRAEFAGNRHDIVSAVWNRLQVAICCGQRWQEVYVPWERGGGRVVSWRIYVVGSLALPGTGHQTWTSLCSLSSRASGALTTA